jgi:hypothetical protein
VARSGRVLLGDCRAADFQEKWHAQAVHEFLRLSEPVNDLIYLDWLQGRGGIRIFEPIGAVHDFVTAFDHLLDGCELLIVLWDVNLKDGPQGGGPTASATWHYSLAGDALNVSVQGNSMLLQRVR